MANQNNTTSVTNPHHYKQHPSGIECIVITRHFNFNLGNVIKYIWRSPFKHKDMLVDLEKAYWYLGDEIARIKLERGIK
jgi:hypothetical protein